MTIKLTTERKKRGMSQFDLSRITGIHETDISKIESGKHYIFDGWKKRIASALDWDDDVDILFKEEDTIVNQ